MPWRLIITPKAEKDLDNLPDPDCEAVRLALNRLIIDPASVDKEKMAGTRDCWRIRVGRWRVIMRWETKTGTMYALAVLSRDKAYR
ncbi:MAG: type II toxin-antitoxin system RelE/ParE family toxin [Chloroflexi bacterium]|nr:type II toxin-antitoxin system RelE/ParE family toxin [Chloroflexota bacterium]